MATPNRFVGLNKHLIGSIFPMKRTGDGTVWERDNTQEPFQAPLTQASLELGANWASPFESAGVEAKFGALSQMAQSGMFQGVLRALGASVSEDDRKDANKMGKLSEAAKGLMGRTGQTALNSVQVYSGSPPSKIQITAFLAAFKDPWTEVEEPIKRLQEWMVPQHLAPDGVIAEFLTHRNILSLMPSLTPQVLGFTYHGRIFQPMVCESCSDPLDAPIDKNGHRISASIQITLTSLTAWDKQGWNDTYKSQPVAR